MYFGGVGDIFIRIEECDKCGNWVCRYNNECGGDGGVGEVGVVGCECGVFVNMFKCGDFLRGCLLVILIEVGMG